MTFWNVFPPERDKLPPSRWHHQEGSLGCQMATLALTVLTRRPTETLCGWDTSCHLSFERPHPVHFCSTRPYWTTFCCQSGLSQHHHPFFLLTLLPLFALSWVFSLSQLAMLLWPGVVLDFSILFWEKYLSPMGLGEYMSLKVWMVRTWTWVTLQGCSQSECSYPVGFLLPPNYRMKMRKWAKCFILKSLWKNSIPIYT